MSRDPLRWIITAVRFMCNGTQPLQVFMNFRRKSTMGWSIGNILLDLTGGLFNFAQMAMQSIDQDTWVNFYGNIGKTLLSLEVIFFDLIFIFQHYVFYPAKKEDEHPTIMEERIEPLVKPAEQPSAKSGEPEFSSNV